MKALKKKVTKETWVVKLNQEGERLGIWLCGLNPTTNKVDIYLNYFCMSNLFSFMTMSGCEVL